MKRTNDTCMVTVNGQHAFLFLTRSTWDTKQKKSSSETLVNMKVLNRPEDIEAAKRTLKAFSRKIAYVE